MVETTETRVKIGAKVEESVYASFKQYVYEQTGQKRGVLGEAVEAALIDYMDDDPVSDDGDVSNSDLLREIRSLQHSDAPPAPPPPATAIELNELPTSAVRCGRGGAGRDERSEDPLLSM